ncbi:hypothetical protein [uncultured Pontibacter sp.]|uniref:hypothetical protein n=1 Tax=uncultured Pontibacter sp. TaxID=453356 RepID=UPI0026101E51|nr:hypothetical protein [uncultured Pontibacter sp.]
MKYYFLRKDEFKQLIENRLFNKNYPVDHELLEEVINSTCNYWDVEIVGFNYFFSKILETYLKKSYACADIIDFVYGLSDEMYFSRQEFDSDFIHLLMTKHPRNANSSLEEDLLQAVCFYYEK